MVKENTSMAFCPSVSIKATSILHVNAASAELIRYNKPWRSWVTTSNKVQRSEDSLSNLMEVSQVTFGAETKWWFSYPESSGCSDRFRQSTLSNSSWNRSISPGFISKVREGSVK